MEIKEPHAKKTELQIRLAASEGVSHFSLIARWLTKKKNYFEPNGTKKKLKPTTKKIRNKPIKCAFQNTERILASEIRQAGSSERRYTKSKLMRRYREEV